MHIQRGSFLHYLYYDKKVRNYLLDFLLILLFLQTLEKAWKIQLKRRGFLGYWSKFLENIHIGKMFSNLQNKMNALHAVVNVFNIISENIRMKSNNFLLDFLLTSNKIGTTISPLMWHFRTGACWGHKNLFVF